MKNSTKFLLSLAIFGLTSTMLKAQDYAFTLINNGNYSFTIAAIPNFDSGTFQPITQSYGFVIVLPDGVTITADSYLPAGTNGTATFINGADVVSYDPEMADNDLYLITTDTAGRRFPTHTSGQIIPMVTLTVNGMPTIGEIRILDNNSTLAKAPALLGSLDSFIQVDVIDNGTFLFANEFSGLTGTVFYNFGTLGVLENELTDNAVSVYPNPASEVIHISSTTELTKIELYDVLGKRVLTTNKPQEIKIDHLKSGIYLLKIYASKGQMTKKIIKQ